MIQATLATAGRAPLAADDTARRALVRLVARLLGPYLVLFAVVDDHVHAVLRGDRAEIGRALAALALAIGAAVEVQPWHISPVRDRRHLEVLSGYLFGQADHHELAARPLVWPGSCLPDLLGARLLPGFDRGLLGVALPRWTEEELLVAADLGPEPLAPVPLDRVALARLAAAPASALGLGPVLPARGAEAASDRRAAVQLCERVGFTTKAVAAALDASERTVRRLREEPPEVDLEVAARRWLALEQRVATVALRVARETRAREARARRSGR